MYRRLTFIWQNKRSKGTGFLFILPSLLGMIVFLLIPFLDVVRRSFLGAVNGKWAGINNYVTVFQNEAFLLAGKNTLKFTGVCIPLLLLISLGVSVLLYGIKREVHMLKMSFLVPMAIPAASVVLFWRLLFHKQGFLNGIISTLGFTPVDWMNTNYAFGVLVVTYLWKNIGYDVILWSAGLAAIPNSMYEAAQIDGAGKRTIFFKITLPNLRAVFYMIVVLSLINSFKVFREAYLVAGEYPHDSMYLLQHLFNNWFRELSLDKISAAAVIVAVVISIVMTVLEKMLKED